MITTTTIIGRAIISLLFIIVGHLLMRFGGTVYLKIMQMRRKNTKWPSEIWNKTPTLVYFKTPDCSVCKYQQQKIVERVHKQYTEKGTDLILHQFDASSQVDYANLFGIVTVPTTVILDRKGEIAAFNTGITKEKKLWEQVKNVI